MPLSSRLAARITTGLALGLVGAWASIAFADHLHTTQFMVPAVTSVVAILIAGGFWPAMAGSLIAWSATAWLMLGPGAATPAGSGEVIRMSVALLSFAAGCFIDGRARRERARLHERERDLVDSESRYRMLLDHASDAILVVGPTFHVEASSTRADELLGRAPGTLIGMALGDLLPLDALGQVSHEWPSVAREARCTVTRPDGSTFVGELSFRALPDRRVQLIVRDGTLRDREVRAVREERDLLDAVLATSEAGIIVLEMPSQRVLFANQQFADQWGTTREALLMRGAADHEYEFTSEDGTPLPGGYAPIQMVAETGAVVRDERLRIRKRGGPWRMFSVNGAPLRRADGSLRAVAMSTVDVTDRLATASALSLSEERLRRLTDAVPGCVYQFRREADGHQGFTFTSGGARELAGLPPDAPLPELAAVMEMVAPDDRARMRASIEESARNLSRWTEEFQLTLPDGTRKWIRGSSVPEPPLPDGSMVWHGILTDITERKRLEEGLLQVQKMESIGRLAGGIAHDFNNILTAIRGNIDLILDEVDDHHPHVHELRDIRDASERAATLTRQLLAFSRKQALQARHLDLGALVREVEKMLRRVIGEDVVLLTQPAEEPGMVRADAGQLEQVLLNLAVNARDAMPDGGLLTIETRNVQLDATTAAHHGVDPGDYVSLVVRDTGTGMDPETRARIFDPFFTTKPAGKGTGLGLAMVYGIVRQNGGAIAVETEVGRGATFRLYFPRSLHGDRRMALRDTPTSVEAGRFAPDTTILLVEDDAAVRTLTRRMLQEAGFVVLAAGDAYEALTLAGPTCDGITAVVTDVIMPGIGGRDLVRELRGRRAELQVLYISGYLDVDSRRLELDGRTRLLAKPFTRDALLRNLAALIEHDRVRA